MTPIELTLGQFRQIFTHVPDADVQKYHAAVGAGTLAYGMHNAQRLAAYCAQIDHESGGLLTRAENLHYSGERLIAVWPKRFRDLEEAKFYAEAGPESIANRVYADRMGNGPESSGDGWRYRGQGLIQLTGKDNYLACEHETLIPVVAHPERAQFIEEASMIAGWFWAKAGCNQLADHDQFDAISDEINLGHRTGKIGDANGYADRFQRWMKARQVLGLSTSGLI
jgi:putative chitinase